MASFIDPSVLPFVGAFLFVFAIVFGLLNAVKIMGEQRKVNAIIAVVFAAFSVVYSPFVTALQGILPVAAIVLVVLFFLLFLKKIFEGGGTFDAVPVAVSLAVSLLLLGIFWDRIGVSVPGMSSENVLWLIIVIIVALIFYVAYKQGTE